MKTVSYTLNNTTFTFDTSTGALTRLDYPGTPSMIQEGKGLFDLSWPVHTDYDTLRLNPTGKYCATPPVITYESDTITLAYPSIPRTVPTPEGMAELEGGVSAIVTLRACGDGKSVSMRLVVENHSDAEVVQVLFPDMNGIVPTADEEHDVLTMLGGSEKPFVELKSTPKTRENFFAWTESCAGRFHRAGGFQPGPLIGRWYDMGSRKGGFSMYRKHWGWGPDDQEAMGYGEQLWVKLDNLSGKLRLAFLRDTKIGKGETYDSGEYILTAHTGPWIKGIGPYKDYVASQVHRVVEVPQRAKEMFGFRTVFMANGYTKDPDDYSWKYDDMPTLAADMKEHGLYDLNVWGAFMFTLPTGSHCFYEEWGGLEAWKRNVEKLKEMCVVVTPLVSWISLWDQTAKNYGITERSGSWAETPKSVPMFKAPYCERWSCYQIHDHSPENWRKDIRDGLRFFRDEAGCPDICWDQYVLGDNQDDIVHDIINEYRLETEEMYPGTVFSAESTLYFESELDNTDFTWNWLYWPGRGDMRPYMHVIRTLRPNINVDSEPSYVKFIFMDNYVINVYPSKPENYNGSALISEYPEFSKAVKTCAALRGAYLDYFIDGIMVSDCPVDMDQGVPCRITGYQKDDALLLIVYKYNDDTVQLPLELADYLSGRKVSYRICDEENKVVGTGCVEANGMLSLSGEKDALYMIEFSAGESQAAE